MLKGNEPFPLSGMLVARAALCTPGKNLNLSRSSRASALI